MRPTWDNAQDVLSTALEPVHELTDAVDLQVRVVHQYAATTEPWTARENELLDELFAPLAEALGRERDDVAAKVLQGGHASMALAFAFEESATVHWNNEGKSLVDVYLAHRGWREKPGGRRYLQALNAAEIALWEVVAVTPGQSIDVRRYGGGVKVTRVQEQSGSESLRVYDAIAARVIVVDGERMIAGESTRIPGACGTGGVDWVDGHVPSNR